MATTVVYTDGAALGNPGPAGWAWAVPGGLYASGAEQRSTNQRMEITAVLEALKALGGRVHVRSDSTYVVNCFRDRWWERWIQKDWTTSARKPVANRDLWEPLIGLYLERPGDLTFEWVKGHGGDPSNDLVDRLAVEAAETQQGRSGEGTPADLGPPDVPEALAGRAISKPPGRDPRLPSGHVILIAGHRPPELGGYEENPTAARVRTKLVEILQAKRQLHPDAVVVTGLNLGAEQLGAQAAREAGLPYVAVLGYPNPESVWPSSSQNLFRELLEGAERTVVLQKEKPDSKQKAGAALARRDGWLAAQADEALVVWDGADKRIGRFARTLEDKLEDVWVVDPSSP